MFNKDSHFIPCDVDLALHPPSVVSLAVKDSLLPGVRLTFDFSGLSEFLEHFEMVPMSL